MKEARYENPTAAETLEWCEAEDIKLRHVNGVLRKIVPHGKTIPQKLLLAIRQHEAELITRVAPRGGLVALQTVAGSGIDATPSELPQIDASNKDIPDVTQLAWAALVEANDPPRLFRYAGEMSRLEVEDGRAAMRPLTPERLSYELARAADWFIPTEKGTKPAIPPLHVIKDMLATPEPPLPILERMTHAPYFAPDGRLVAQPGYDELSRTILFIDAALELPAMPERPTDDDIERARNLILDELYGDFPFVSDADRANAVALYLLPYVRQMIAGPTPNHLIEASTAGSGKGLLADAAMRPAAGTHIGVITGARDDDEWRKRISSKLREAAPVILIDNITQALDSGSFASALTASIWTDRLLGTNATLVVPVRCVWITTANNPAMTTEIARRTIRIRLDPKVDRPWQRTGFHHEHLIAWVDAHRAELVHAALVLIRAWLAANQPRSSVVLGSYEQWATIMGGILSTAGVTGFLDNLDEFYEAADPEGAAWRQLVGAWWEEHKDTEVGAKDLFKIADEIEGFNFKGLDKARSTAFGMALGKQRDRVIGDYRIVSSGIKHKVRRWRLLPITITPLLPPDPGAEGDLSEKGTPPDSPCDTSLSGEGGVPRGTFSNPSPIEDAPVRSRRQSRERYPEVPLPADKPLPDKEKEGGYLLEGPPAADCVALRDWAAEIAQGWEDDAPIPNGIRTMAQRAGFTFDAFAPPGAEAKRLLAHLSDDDFPQGVVRPPTGVL